MRNSLMCIAAGLLVGGAATANTPNTNTFDNLMKFYPKRALAAGEQGMVGFSLTLDRAGHPTACEVTHSSGHKQLDDETCDLLMLHVEFQPPKDSNGKPLNSFKTGGVINWHLPGSKAPVARPVKVAAADPLDKKICKRTPRIGTLAGFERTCMTAREWKTTRDQHVVDFEELQGKKGFTQGN